MRLLFCGSGWLPIVDAIRERLPADDSISIWDRDRPLTEATQNAHVILPSNGHIDAAAIEAAAELRLIQQPAAGVDGIDLEAARSRGIPVCNAPGANRVAVAEATLLLILSLARRVPKAAAAFGRREVGVPLGIELSGRVIGIVGSGRIGRTVAQLATALGMTVRSTRSTSSRADLLSMLRDADVVTLHCPLNDDTRHMIDAEAFAAMKPGAMLVNCARGAIIERAALDAALASGHLGGLGLDTFWHEPWDPADPLFARDEVVSLPHIAGSTEESFARIADIVCENVARIRNGQDPAHRVA